MSTQQQPPVLGETVIDRPAADVFDYLADMRNLPTYNHAASDGEKTSTGPIGPGTRFRVRMRMMGARIPLTITLLRFDRPSELTYRNTLLGLDSTGQLSFQAIDDATRLTVKGRIEPPTPLAFLAPIFHRFATNEWARGLPRLKQQLEK